MWHGKRFEASGWNHQQVKCHLAWCVNPLTSCFCRIMHHWSGISLWWISSQPFHSNMTSILPGWLPYSADVFSSFWCLFFPQQGNLLSIASLAIYRKKSFLVIVKNDIFNHIIQSFWWHDLIICLRDYYKSSPAKKPRLCTLSLTLFLTSYT